MADWPIELGQVWKECDPRHPRLVLVIGFEGDKVCIQSILNDTPRRYGRRTLASRARFNGKRGGYELVLWDRLSGGSTAQRFQEGSK